MRETKLKIVVKSKFSCYHHRCSYVFCHRKSVPPPPPPPLEITGEDASHQTDKKQQTCLECIGDIAAKMHLQPSGVTSMSHELMSLRTNEKYRKLTRYHLFPRVSHCKHVE